MTKSKIHFDVLPGEQKDVWKLLSPVSKMGFVLYGGTAVALHLGHRHSVDFDFFSSQQFAKEDIKRLLPFLDRGKVTQDSKNTYTIITATNVKISFFGGIHLGRVGTPLTMPGTTLQIASLDDLLAMKLATIFNRIEFKDYFDISAMLQNGMDLSKGLSAARSLYGNQFQPSIILKTLTYFEGGDLELLSEKDKKVLVNAVKNVTTLQEIPILSYTLYAESAQEDAVSPCGCTPCH